MYVITHTFVLPVAHAGRTYHLQEPQLSELQHLAVFSSKPRDLKQTNTSYQFIVFSLARITHFATLQSKHNC